MSQGARPSSVVGPDPDTPHIPVRCPHDLVRGHRQDLAAEGTGTERDSDTDGQETDAGGQTFEDVRSEDSGDA